MAVSITSSYGYFWLDSWVLANILQLGTQSFCERFVTHEIDPGRRMFDQMTMAARSVPANVAEGASRRNTSTETEMRLTDVGRGSLGELQGDYMNFLLKHCRAGGFYARGAMQSPGVSSASPVWSVNSPQYRAFAGIRLDAPSYTADLLKDVSEHILRQKAKFDAYIESTDPIVAANALMYLCARIVRIVRHQLEAQLERFKQSGGFTENMTDTRLQAKREQNQLQGAPTCPKCGAVMVKKVASKGIHSGEEFWSCSNYQKTGCNTIIPIKR